MTKRVEVGRKASVGDDLVEAFNEMARYLRGEIDVECYGVENSAAKTKSPDRVLRRRSRITKA